MIMRKDVLLYRSFIFMSCFRVRECKNYVMMYISLNDDTRSIANDSGNGESSVSDSRRGAKGDDSTTPILSLNGRERYVIGDDKNMVVAALFMKKLFVIKPEMSNQLGL